MRYLIIFLFLFAIQKNSFSEIVDLKQYNEKYSCVMNKYGIYDQSNIISGYNDIPKDKQRSVTLQFKHVSNLIVQKKLNEKNLQFTKGFGLNFSRDKSIIFMTPYGEISSLVKENILTGKYRERLGVKYNYAFYTNHSDTLLSNYLSFFTNGNIILVTTNLKRPKTNKYYQSTNEKISSTQELIDKIKTKEDFSEVVLKLNELYQLNQEFYDDNLQKLTVAEYQGDCRKIQ